jgi:hypothetical protein
MNIFCSVVALPSGKLRCPRCLRPFHPLDRIEDNIVRICSLPIARRAPAGCVHRGEQLRLQECPTCCGSVRVKVFACAIHGECVIEKNGLGLARCWTCPEFRASAVEATFAPP